MLNKYFDYKKILLYALNISFIFYILILLGISRYVPKYLDTLKIILKIYIGLILVFFYNPYSYKKSIDKFDRKMLFSTGLILLFSTALFQSVEIYIKSQSIYLINKTKIFI
jgi:hypothetical protein